VCVCQYCFERAKFCTHHGNGFSFLSEKRAFCYSYKLVFLCAKQKSVVGSRSASRETVETGVSEMKQNLYYSAYKSVFFVNPSGYTWRVKINFCCLPFFFLRRVCVCIKLLQLPRFASCVFV